MLLYKSNICLLFMHLNFEVIFLKWLNADLVLYAYNEVKPGITGNRFWFSVVLTLTGISKVIVKPINRFAVCTDYYLKKNSIVNF